MEMNLWRNQHHAVAVHVGKAKSKRHPIKVTDDLLPWGHLPDVFRLGPGEIELAHHVLSCRVPFCNICLVLEAELPFLIIGGYEVEKIT